MRYSRLATVVLAGAMLSACGSSRSTELFSEQRTLEKSGDAAPIAAQAEALWKGRAERAKAEGAIKLWEQAAKLDPTRADLQLALTYGYYFMANVHVRWDEDNEDAMRTIYEKGMKAGRNAVWLTSPKFAEQIKAGTKWEAAVGSVDKASVPGLYWYATNMGKWALLDGFTTILREKDHIAATMETCQKLDANYWHGGPDRYFGVYRTKIPFPGGDLPASKAHFAKAVELAPGYLDTKVLFATNYAAKAQDEALFKKLLNEVIATADDVVPELVPENRNAKRLAKQLLEDIEDYF
jgi:tetratricopeptide (TPR) repeat protein